MRKQVSRSHAQAMGLCLLLAAGAAVSCAGEAPGPASAATPIPDMTCQPVPANHSPLPPRRWNDCVGAFTFQNGNSYRGEFHHGKRDGFGVLAIRAIGASDYNDIEWDEPALYIGDFGSGRLNGYGLLIGKSGAAYAGTFKDNIAQLDLVRKECRGEVSADWTDCIGTYRFPDGNVYRGEFAHGLPDGMGMLQVKAMGTSDATQVRLPMPGAYVGEFKKGKLSAQGAVVMSSGGYFGRFSDNRFRPGRPDSPLRGARAGPAGAAGASDK